MKKCNKKRIEVKLESVDPTGVTVKSKSFGMKVIDDKDCMRVERLVLHVGDCLYRIDKNGYIIERLVPHEEQDTNVEKPIPPPSQLIREGEDPKPSKNTTPPPPPPADRVLREGKTPKPPKK